MKAGGNISGTGPDSSRRWHGRFVAPLQIPLQLPESRDSHPHQPRPDLFLDRSTILYVEPFFVVGGSGLPFTTVTSRRSPPRGSTSPYWPVAGAFWPGLSPRLLRHACSSFLVRAQLIRRDFRCSRKGVCIRETTQQIGLLVAACCSISNQMAVEVGRFLLTDTVGLVVTGAGPCPRSPSPSRRGPTAPPGSSSRRCSCRPVRSSMEPGAHGRCTYTPSHSRPTKCRSGSSFS